MKRLRFFIACIIIGAISYFYLSFFRNHFYALLADEGYAFYQAKRILLGQVMYKDFFQLLPPGTVYLLVLIYKIFGFSYGAGMITAIIIDSLINVLLFYLGYKAIKSWYAILLPLFFPTPGFLNFMQYSHYWTSMFFLFIALAFFLSYLEHNKNLPLVAAGIFIGITWLFLPTTGTYAALLFFALFMIERRKEKAFAKQMSMFLVSMSIPLLIIFGFLAWQGAFYDFVKEYLFGINVYARGCTINPIDLYFSDRGYPLYPYSLLFLSFTGIAVFSGIALFFFRSKFSNPVKVILMGDVIQVLSSSSRMDLDHILINSALSLVILLLFVKWMIGILLCNISVKNKEKFDTSLENPPSSPFVKGGKRGILFFNMPENCLRHADRTVGTLHKFIRYAFNIIVAACVVWCLLIMYTNVVNRYEHAYTMDINGTRLWTYNKQQVWDINQFFPKVEKRLQGDKNVFVYPYCPLVYVLYGLNNPTSMDFMFANPLLSAMPNSGPYGYDRIVQELKKTNAQYVIYCNFPQDYINFELGLDYKHDRANAVDEFMSSQYIPVLKVDQLVLYKRVKSK